MKKFSFRKSVDITPWDKKGGSAFGLKRHQAKWIATVLIIFSIVMMSPPSIPDPGDIINIFLASKISTLTGWTSMESMVLTYTIIPWLIFLLGIYLYPYNTESLFNGYINKLKKLIKRAFKNPILLIAMFLIGRHVFQWYVSII